MKLLPFSLAILVFAAVSVGITTRPARDLVSEVVRFEGEYHEALRHGDIDRLTRLLPQAEHFESQLLQVLEDPRSSAHQRESLQPLLDMIQGLRADAARLAAERDWRRRSRPRIERPPDPKLISIIAEEDGQTIIMGEPGAAGDTRARIVRAVNLFTSDQAAALVQEDGSFRLRLIAPPGSSVQISTSIQEDFPEELRDGLASPWGIDLAGQREDFQGMIQGDRSCSPGLILPVRRENPVARDEAWFVRKLGKGRWLFGTAHLSRKRLEPGEIVEAFLVLSIGCESEAAAHRLAVRDFDVHCSLTPLFNQNGQQLSAIRLSATHVLTPTGLPIETQTDLVGRRDHQGRIRAEPGPQGVETHIREVEFGRWRVRGRVAKGSLKIRFDIPRNAPPGTYSLNGHIQLSGVSRTPASRS